jgi:hypothetical protein
MSSKTIQLKLIGIKAKRKKKTYIISNERKELRVSLCFECTQIVLETKSKYKVFVFVEELG